MSSVQPVRPARLPLEAVLRNAPLSSVSDGAKAPSLPRVQRHFISLKVWKPRQCARAIMRFLETEFNDEVFHLVLQTYRAWQLVHFCKFQPAEALRFVSKVRNYCFKPNDLATVEVPLRPPPFGYKGCIGCWKSLDRAKKRGTWHPFWIAKGKMNITDIGGNCGGGGGGAVDDGAAAGNGP